MSLVKMRSPVTASVIDELYYDLLRPELSEKVPVFILEHVK